MKKITLLFIAIIFSVNGFSQAPIWLWAESGNGGPGFDEEGRGIAVDASGNCYVTGYYNGTTITFGSITLTNTGPGYREIFIGKYDASGNVVWAKSAGGNYPDRALAIAADANGNCYIIGDFYSDSISFDSITLMNADTNYYRDVFIA